MPELVNAGCRRCNAIMLIREGAEPPICDGCKAAERAKERQADKDDDA